MNFDCQTLVLERAGAFGRRLCYQKSLSESSTCGTETVLSICHPQGRLCWSRCIWEERRTLRGTNIEHSLLRLWQSLSFAWSRDRRASGKQPATWQGAPEVLTTSWVSSVCSRSSHWPQGHRVLARPQKKDSAFVVETRCAQPFSEDGTPLPDCS